MLASARSNSALAKWFLLGLLGLAVFQVTVLSATPAAAQEAAADGEKHEQPKSKFMWIIESSGVIGLFILILSIYFIATLVRLFMEIRTEVVMPPIVIEQCNAMLEQRNIQGMFELVKGDEAFFSQVLAAGIAELPHGLGEAREAAERQAESLTVELEKKISMMAVLGTLGPMIGLLGTLMGMISSFSVIALSTTGLKPSEVAGGISEALILTFEGVALSVPNIWAYAYFKNRVSTYSVSGQLLADDFLRRINKVLRKGAAPAGRAAAGV